MSNSAGLPSVWRINLKSAAASGVDPRRFCIDNGILGFGWPVQIRPIPTADEYRGAASRQYPLDNGWKKAFNALQNMSEGDLCWTRDLKGTYYLGRVTGAWSYVTTDDHVRADIVNVRPCAWISVGPVDEVPGKVVASFRPAATLQRIDDSTVQLYSAYLYNRKASVEYSLPEQPVDIFSLLRDDDCEDLVGLWMQLEGYVLYPSSCKLSTVGYEWIMVHRASGRRAAAQVKSGNCNLRPADYAEFSGPVYLFTSQGQFLGTRPNNVRCIEVSEMRDFLNQHRPLLPNRIARWMDFTELDTRIAARAGSTR